MRGVVVRLRVVKCGKLRTRTAFWGPGLRLRGIEEHEYKESIAIELGSALKCIEETVASLCV